MELYSVIAHNGQGASDGKSGLTREQVDAWLDGWQDPQNLSVTVKDQGGEIVATKELGETVISW
jgi:hypothetical protein